MGMLFGAGQTISTEEPRIGALRIQTSAYGLAIPFVRGKTRLNGNLTWYDDFKAIAHTTTQESGGKGGGGVTSKNTTYTYTTAVAVGLCEGPITGIGAVWAGKEKTTLAALGLSLFTGTRPQTPWGYLSTYHPGEALGYPGLAYVAAGALDLGNGAQLPNMGFEIIAPAFGGGIVDANPKDVVSDFLSETYAGAGFPAAKLGDLTQFSNYCVANGLFLSPAFIEQRPAQEHLTELLRAANAAPVWSEGTLKIIPSGDTAATGNGATYTPQITPVYDLTDDDFLYTEGEDPILVRRKTTADAYNRVQVEYLDRAGGYNPAIVEVKDQANIEAYGLRSMDPVKIHAICVSSIAQFVASILLQRALYIRNEYEFRLGWRHCLLEPMDIVTLTDPRLGLDQTQVRILSVEEDEEGELRILAEEFPFGIATPPLIPVQAQGGYSVDLNKPPGNANAPVMFEPPVSLAGAPQLWLATSGGADWGGAEVWVSLDNASYQQVGTIHGAARHGTLTATLPTGGDPDAVNTLAVDLSVSSGQLLGGTLEDRDLYHTLSYADGELISFQTAALTGANRYNLSSLRRGAYGTPIAAHASGTKFARLDQAIFRYAYDPALLGRTLYLKLRSFNTYGGAAQDLATLSPSTYTLVGAPLGGVAGLALAQPFTGRSASIKWSAAAGASSYKVEVWVGAVLKRTISNLGSASFTYTFEDSKADGGPYRAIEFRVYAVSANGQSGSAAILAVSNPQVAAPTGLLTSTAGSSLSISANRPADTDYAGTKVWMSQTSGFDPLVTTPVYDGPDNAYSGINLAAATWYLRLAHYDVFGTDGLNISSEVGVVVVGASAGVPTVGTLPANPAAVGGSEVILLSTDRKLYRWNGSTWIKAADGGDLTAATVTADKITVANLAAITANLGAATAGSMTLDAAGFIRGGATGYLTGAGFWAGYHSTTYKFHFGNPTGEYIAWTGSNLSIQSPQFTLSGGNATFSGALSAATGSFGAVTAEAGVTVSSTGHIKGGQTDFSTGSGFFLGYSGGSYKFSIGDPAGNYMSWDGSALNIKARITDDWSYSAGTGGTLYSSAAEVYTGSASDVVAKSWTSNTTGPVNVNFQHKTGGAGAVNAAVYKNGVLQTSWSTSSTTYVARVQALTIVPGDLIEVKHNNGGSGQVSYVNNFSITSGGGSYTQWALPAVAAVSSTTYTKLKEVQLPRAGTVSVTFELAGNGGATGVYGRIYKNDVAVGTERGPVSSTTYVAYTEDIAIAAGDRISLYCKYATNSGNTQKFDIRANQLPTIVVPLVGA